MKYIFLFIILTLPCKHLFAQLQFEVDSENIGAEIQPEMYGIFFEDINFGADGGLYAELIKNRSFEFDHPFTGWTPFGDVKIADELPCFDKNPRYVKLNENGQRTGTGLENSGFRGIGFKENKLYRFSIFARSTAGPVKKIKVECINASNAIIGEAEINITGNTWGKYEIQLLPRETVLQGKIRLTLLTVGEVDLDHISLFPVDTWRGRENGLRKDLVQALYNLNPGVFRFPGGCIVEGNTLETRYQWKNSVGPPENRPLNNNRWNYTFKHRLFPDYYQSYGLGFFEYFLLSEDLGAEPLPVVSCGLACQFESEECVPVDDLETYIQDAVDLIEFANGSVNSTWGKIRAEMGHPEPFNLKMIAIGNEQWGEVYVERLVKFMEVFRQKHPEIKIIGSSGPFPEGEFFDYLWPKMKELQVDLVDEHYYRSPEWFLANATRYDKYDRNGPHVFAGEYAAHDINRDNNHGSAIAEAAFMTGLERNADIVDMATYAPLFAHVDAWQWKPDMIWFNNLEIVLTPNYFVQKLFGRNSGTHVLSITSNDSIIAGNDSLYASAIVNKKTSEIIVKVVNASSENREIQIKIKSSNYIPDADVIISFLQNNNPTAINTITKPFNVVPGESFVPLKNKSFQLNAEQNAFYVCRIKVNEK